MTAVQQPDPHARFVSDLHCGHEARPRLLDLFCCAGGAAMGYHQAGFDVVGVDIKPQPRYPFEFHQADAMTYPLDGFDAVHASPPCQDHSATKHLHGRAHGTAWMLDGTRERLLAQSTPWVIENVPRRQDARRLPTLRLHVRAARPAPRPLV